ncbi:MAG: hypothetical protein IV100_19575 [Myxococcales bacterium]|nr:hypothetical protein [Myxococcales bacterium]
MTITSVDDAVRAAAPRPVPTDRQDAKKNYAERLSRHLSTAIANNLRPDFPGITPSEDGAHQEARARSAKGFKKLDVGYATLELGLGLGVSVKTVTLPDPKAGRYTKNYSRIDNELRAESTDYHKRQPYSVLVAALFLPWSAADDAIGTGSDAAVSSFAAAVRYFRPRAGRAGPSDDVEKFERMFICLYDDSAQDEARFFDVDDPPRRSKRPAVEETLSFSEFIASIRAAYDARNSPPFSFKD